MTFDLNVLTQYGALGVTLIIFATLHFRSIKAGEKREAQMAENLARARTECREDTQRLVVRVESLEESRAKDLAGVLNTCAEALRMNAHAFSIIAETESGRHEVRR